MNVVLVVVSWCLLGQLDRSDEFTPRWDGAPPATIDPDERRDVEPRRRSFDDDEPARRTDSDARGRKPWDEPEPDDRNEAIHTRLLPPQLLAEALADPEQGAIVGKKITLATALGRVTNRAQLLKIAQSYWKLSAALARYDWALDWRERLKHYTEGHTSNAEVLSARAAARADLADCKLQVNAAQQELADLLGMPKDAELPLASDFPHVGGYDTHFEDYFGKTPAPPRIQLINRMLPLRRKAIDLHGEAIVAALDSLDSVGDSVLRDRAAPTALWPSLDQLRTARRAFLNHVAEYNQEIAEYLFAVAPATTDTPTLASHLILKSERSAREPDRLTPRNAPREAEPRDEDDLENLRRSRAGGDRTSRYRPEDMTDEVGMYQGFADLPEAQMAQKLSDVLHWDRVLPRDVGDAISLADCLRGARADNRVSILSAYWIARERAAAYQIHSDQVEHIRSLARIVIAHRDQPGINDAGVHLQAARQAALASAADAHVALLQAQFNLTTATGRRLERAWLVPTTAPQSGGYELGTQAPRREPQRAARVRLEHDKIQERALAVVRFDASRAELVNEARNGNTRRGNGGLGAVLDDAVRAITMQRQESLAYLHDLTTYNAAIANYVMAVMPANATNEELVRMLVVSRPARNEG